MIPVTEPDPGDEQPALLDSLAAPRQQRLPGGAAETLPIARVVLDSPVPHLDRLFDYVVAAEVDDRVVAGCRVKVKFSGREMQAYVIERVAEPTTAARLSLITKVVSSQPVLTGEVYNLARRVADRGAGTVSDVLRSAIPPRVAKVEQEFAETAAAPDASDRAPDKPPGPRQAELSLKTYGPGSWPERIVERVSATVGQGGDAVVVLPDQRDVELAGQHLAARLGEEQIARLTADIGPTPRYRSFLRLRHGQAKVAVGTRSAIFAPVANPQLIIIVDDAESTHAEPRAPYHHVRDVALLRTVMTGSGLLFLSTSRSLEVQRLVERRWLEDLAPDREERRDAAPLMVSTADSYQQERDPASRSARLPAAAYRAARQGLEYGPVLIQVGRSGFVPAVICERCQTRQQCPECHGPLSVPPHHQQSGTLRCRWCGLHHRAHRCNECGNTRFRAAARGADRTAQELGRAFPNTPVISSTLDHPVKAVGEQPALVISTPGVEPIPSSGYSAALLLDGNAQLAREGLDVPRQVLARWFRAASLVRPHRKDASRSGTVVVTADAEELTSALVRWDPVTYAQRELYRRLELGLPPARRMLSLTAEPSEAEELIRRIPLPEGLGWIGPSALDDGRHRYLLFFSYAQAEAIIGDISRIRRTYSAQHGRAHSSRERSRGARIAVDDVEALQM